MGVDELLERQGGMARRRQLRRAGMSRRAIASAVAAGRLRPLTPDLYATSDPRPDDLLRGAVLRLDAVISNQSAALLWGVELATTPAEPHVTVGRNRARAAHAGVEVHRRDVGPDEREYVDGIPVTSLVRTLLDLARSLPLAEAVAAVDSALRQRLVTLDALAAAAEALPPGQGRPKVQRVLELADPQAGSVLESLFRVLIAERGLPAPRSQLSIRGAGRVDFAWEAQRLVVETDGFAFHSDRASYRNDRRRGNALVRRGWAVLRFSWEDVVRDPDYVVASVREVLADRGVVRAAA